MILLGDGLRLKVFRDRYIYSNNLINPANTIHILGIIDRCKLPRESQENIVNYINDEICSIMFIQY